MVTMSLSSSNMFRFILTAAHCININGERVLVKIGDHDKWTEERGESLLQGIAIKPKQYSSAIQGWDVALVRLDRKIAFSDYNGRVGPVCLARRGLYNNDKAVVKGWGATLEGGQKVPGKEFALLLTRIYAGTLLERGEG